MYKEFDSIFHEETIIYEDKSDIERQYAGRVNRAKEDSKAGHSGARSRTDMSKEYPKTWSRSDGNVDSAAKRTRTPVNFLGIDRNSRQNKYVADTINNGQKSTEISREKRAQEIRSNKKASQVKQEDALFLDFDLI